MAGTRAALIPDIQGSVIASLDSGSGTLSKIGYLPYGNSATGPFGFTAQRIDPRSTRRRGGGYNNVLAKPVRDISDLINNPSQIPGVASVAPGLGHIAELPQAVSDSDWSNSGQRVKGDSEIIIFNRQV